jgi:hypothetical protein
MVADTGRLMPMSSGLGHCCAPSHADVPMLTSQLARLPNRAVPVAILAIAASRGPDASQAWLRPRRCSQAPVSAAATAELIPIAVKDETRRFGRPAEQPSGPSYECGRHVGRQDLTPECEMRFAGS